MTSRPKQPVISVANSREHTNSHQQAPIITAHSLANATRIPAFRHPSETDSTTRDATLPSTEGKGKDPCYSSPEVSANNSSARPAIPHTSPNATRKSAFRRSPEFESSSRDAILPSIETEEGPYYSAPEEPASNSNARPAAPHTSPNTRMPAFRRPPEFDSPDRGATPPSVEADLYSSSPPKTAKNGNTRPRGQGTNDRYRATGQQLRTQDSLHTGSTHAGSSRTRGGSSRRNQPPPSRGCATGRPTRGRSSASPSPPAIYTQAPPRYQRGLIPSRGTIRRQPRGITNSSDSDQGPDGPQGSTRARSNPIAMHITVSYSTFLIPDAYPSSQAMSYTAPLFN
jgi:hypothetical protein